MELFSSSIFLKPALGVHLYQVVNLMG